MNLSLSLDSEIEEGVANDIQFVLLEHVRHNLTVVTYGARGESFDVSLECDDCGVVVLDVSE